MSVAEEGVGAFVEAHGEAKLESELTRRGSSRGWDTSRCSLQTLHGYVEHVHAHAKPWAGAENHRHRRIPIATSPPQAAREFAMEDPPLASLSLTHVHYVCFIKGCRFWC